MAVEIPVQSDKYIPIQGTQPAFGYEQNKYLFVSDFIFTDEAHF